MHITKRFLLRTGLTLWAALLPYQGHAFEPAINDADIKACMVRTLPHTAITQKLTIKLYTGGELASTSSATLAWQRNEAGQSRILVRMTAPKDRAGIAVLAIERSSATPDFYIYLPESHKARRVAGNTIDASLFGTDFSYEDFAYFQGLATEGKMSRLPDETLEGVVNYVLEVASSAAGTKYSKVVSYIDRDRCALTRIDFFGKNSSLTKALEVPRAEVKQMGERWIPRQVILADHKNDTRTELIVDDIQIDPHLDESLFSPTRFGSSE